jgi:hypothetical protein
MIQNNLLKASSWVVNECTDKSHFKREFVNLTLLGVLVWIFYKECKKSVELRSFKIQTFKNTANVLIANKCIEIPISPIKSLFSFFYQIVNPNFRTTSLQNLKSINILMYLLNSNIILRHDQIYLLI